MRAQNIRDNMLRAVKSPVMSQRRHVYSSCAERFCLKAQNAGKHRWPPLGAAEGRLGAAPMDGKAAAWRRRRSVIARCFAVAPIVGQVGLDISKVFRGKKQLKSSNT